MYIYKIYKNYTTYLEKVINLEKYRNWKFIHVSFIPVYLFSARHEGLTYLSMCKSWKSMSYFENLLYNAGIWKAGV